MFIVLLTTFFSCNKKEGLNKDNSRIKILEVKSFGSDVFRIIEVDGVEYLSTYNGGLVKLENNEKL